MQGADSLEKTDAGKDGRLKEKGEAKDEMVGWHHRLNGHNLEQTPGDRKGQRILACCHPQGHKELETTERLSNNRARWSLLLLYY